MAGGSVMPKASRRVRAMRGIRIGSIVIDCTEFGRMLAFWSEALHYVPRDPPKSGWAVLMDPGGKGPNISLNQTDDGPLKDYRLHLDLYVTEPRGELDRLLRLGATLVQPAQQGKDYVTLADPDGNLFDLVDVSWPPGTTEWTYGQGA